jgi:hypothetical protein
MDNWNEITPPQLMDVTLDHEGATARLAEMTASYQAARDGAPPPLEPATAGDARRRLDVLNKDAAWGARLISGDVAARTEFRELLEKIGAGDPAIGAAPPAGGQFDFSSEDQPSRQVLSGTVQMLREAGVSDGAISQALKGTPESPEAIAATKVLKAQRMSDPEWTKRFLAGGATEKREWMLMSIILASEPA